MISSTQQNFNELQNSFKFQKRVHRDPQQQTFKPSFEARVQGYMAAHPTRMERFEETIFKQKEEINKRMTEMSSLLKELTKSNSPEKVLVREEVSNPITKYANVVSLVRVENDKGIESDMVIDENIVEPIKLVDNEEAMDEEEGNEPNGNVSEDSTRWGKCANRLLKIPRSLLIGYYRIAEDVLIDVAGFVYPMDFVILDIEEDECMPLILGTLFLTMTKAKI
ncbi:hypothetical protein Tco_0701019 [Tanacetum coccineum]